MANLERPTLLRREELLDTLHHCVGNLFSTMLSSLGTNVLKRLEPASPRADRAIHCREPGCESTVFEPVEQVVIPFVGTFNGRIVLRFTIESGEDIARGLLMMDESEPIDNSAVCDALCECANMVAGTLKTKALDPVGQHQLGLPSLSCPIEAGQLEGELVYRVAKGVMSVEIWLD